MERPFIGVANQSRSSRIIANIIPFLAVALINSQYVIKESRLPETDDRSNGPLQAAYPNAELEVARSANKQMNVLGHYNISTYPNIVITSLVAKFTKFFMDGPVRQ